MSSIFITTDPQVDAGTVASALDFSRYNYSISGSECGVTYVSSRVDQKTLWMPATHPASQTSVILGGRIALEDSDWKSAESLPYEGGLAAKWILGKWLANRTQLLEQLNGAFLVAIIDNRSQELHLITDPMGVFGVYTKSVRSGQPLYFSSHPDVLAQELRNRGTQIDLDNTTIAECLASGTATQPHTYYRQIYQLECGTHYTWCLSTGDSKQQIRYWNPEYLTSVPDYPDQMIVERLAETLLNSVRRRTSSRFSNVSLLLSGGADSRAALFASRRPSEVNCYTFFDEHNEELETATRLANAARARHQPLKRGRDYYAENAAKTVRVSGGMWNIVDSHFLGFQDTLMSAKPDVVLTGCYADYMFKGLGLNRGYKKILGRYLPLRNMSDFSFEYYHGFSSISHNWNEKVLERLRTRYPSELRREYKDGNILAVESLRLLPLSREADCTGRSTLLRSFPWEPFLVDRDVIEVFGQMNARQKVNGILFGRAVARMLPSPARRIPNNNYQTPIDASEVSRAMWFILGSIRRKFSLRLGHAPQQLATTGSWPNFQFYINHSDCIKQFWHEAGQETRVLMTDIMGFDPWSRTLQEWARIDTMQFLRMLNLILWMELKH